MHEGCSKFVWPVSNQEYWEKKLNRNKQRDINNTEKLQQQGWKVITVWECELRKQIADERLKMLCDEINTNVRLGSVDNELPLSD